ncbi:mitochondrial arginine transporter BAC1-like isoform X2 [Mangifera indica]|uniref:mitochondrial arginine transporter BAC1-like isoform X2 n=1 Tax=Mangifera indica TaxID=29780 RepID=UPI001CF93D6F|nr:mitochondrial arginine transporter BAC1-like isoform X2 [Mangifera indica]
MLSPIIHFFTKSPTVLEESKDFKRFQMAGSSGYKEYVAGLLAGVATVITGHPFDTVKVKLQEHNTETHGIQYKNGLHCTARTLSTDGYCTGEQHHLFLAWLLRVHCFLASTPKQNKFCREWHKNDGPQPQVIIPSAAFGGSVISFVLCPSELVKCRMQVQGTDSLVPNSSRYTSPLDCALKTVKSEGVTAIFRGGSTTLLREALGNAVFSSIYENVRYYMHIRLKAASSDHRNLIDMGIGIVSGGLGGVAFWSAVLPLVVAKTIIQTDPDKNSTRNPFQILNSESWIEGMLCRLRSYNSKGLSC